VDRERLAQRNRQMAEAFHQTPMKHRLRRTFLNMAGRFPFTPLFSKARRILFIRPDHLGDMLLATPALRALKVARPSVEIHVLAGAWSAPILAHYPEIDRVLTIPFPGFDRQSSERGLLDPYTYLLKVSRQLRLIGYEAAVIMRPDHWWGAALAHAAGIQQRIGYNLDDVAPFLTNPIEFRHEHVIRQNLRLIELWTGVLDDASVRYDLPLYEDDITYVEEYLTRCGIATGQRLFAIHPGAGTWVKRWDDQWAVVADTLADQLDSTVVFTGSEKELPIIQHIINRMNRRATITAGDLTVGQLAALYARARVVLGPDSGPLHIAAAVGTPTVALFGPADPVEFGTWGPKHRHAVLTSSIGCRPCRVLDWGADDPANHPCVREIAVGQVLESARRVASET
jgi:lipopolysaccharide heptosyltransferase II